MKDRLNKPQGSGYRDVLLNLIIKGTDGFVMELQLHLRDVINLKEEEHRIYELLRLLGWENDEVDAEILTLEEMEAASRSESSRRGPPALEGESAAAADVSSGVGAMMSSIAKGLMASLGFGKAHTRRSAGVAPTHIHADQPAPRVQPNVAEEARGRPGTLFDAPEVRAVVERAERAGGVASGTSPPIGMTDTGSPTGLKPVGGGQNLLQLSMGAQAALATTRLGVVSPSQPLPAVQLQIEDEAGDVDE